MKIKIRISNRGILILEWIVIVGIMIGVIIPHWNSVPVVKDYFALLIIGELILESYNRIKTKSDNKPNILN